MSMALTSNQLLYTAKMAATEFTYQRRGMAGMGWSQVLPPQGIVLGTMMGGMGMGGMGMGGMGMGGMGMGGMNQMGGMGMSGGMGHGRHGHGRHGHGRHGHGWHGHGWHGRRYDDAQRSTWFLWSKFPGLVARNVPPHRIDPVYANNQPDDAH